MKHLLVGLSALCISTPALAQGQLASADNDQVNFESRFDNALGTEARKPQSYEAVYRSGFEQRIAELANGSSGRIGVSMVMANARAPHSVSLSVRQSLTPL